MMIRKAKGRRAVSAAIRWKRVLAVVLVALAAASCAPFPREVMQRVDEGALFSLVRENPDRYRGKTVLWGGVIVETEVGPQETRILIVNTALDMRKRPDNVDRSEGRFIAIQKGYLDPAIYARGREITVVGEVSGQEERPLGAISYRYPAVTIERLMLWEKSGSTIIYYYGSSWTRDAYPPIVR